MQEAIERLRVVLIHMKSGDYVTDVDPTIDERAAVLNRFQPVLARANLDRLTETDFRTFLMFRHNRHWTGLERQGSRICRDMPTLRQALAILQDESRPIDDRYDYVMDHIKGMGRAITTAVLLVLFPTKYGVWNRKSEEGMKIVDLWPSRIRGESEGSRYARINDILLALSASLDVDLWTLDAIWHYLLVDEAERTPGSSPLSDYGPVLDEEETFPDEAEAADPMAETPHSFILERHLQDFLWHNWDRTQLGQEWERYTEPGAEAAGYEYACGIGRIDILARHRERGDWLVIELKRGQSSDDTVGQVLRYMGWVQKNLAVSGEKVQGLIISRTWDEKLSYAIMPLSNVEVMVYRVTFTLEGLGHRFGQSIIAPENLTTC